VLIIVVVFGNTIFLSFSCDFSTTLYGEYRYGARSSWWSEVSLFSPPLYYLSGCEIASLVRRLASSVVVLLWSRARAFGRVIPKRRANYLGLWMADGRFYNLGLKTSSSRKRRATMAA
jgi:hypothetical protein